MADTPTGRISLSNDGGQEWWVEVARPGEKVGTHAVGFYVMAVTRTDAERLIREVGQVLANAPIERGLLCLKVMPGLPRGSAQPIDIDDLPF